LVFKGVYRNDLAAVVYAPHARSLVLLTRVRFTALAAAIAWSCLSLVVAALPPGPFALPKLCTTGLPGLIAVLACTAGLAVQIRHHHVATRILRAALACVAVIACIFDLHTLTTSIRETFHFLLFPNLAPSSLMAMDMSATRGFILIALLLPLLDASRGTASLVADSLTFVLGVNSLSVLGRTVFAALHVFGSIPANGASEFSVLLLILLTIAAVCHRTQNGALRIFITGGVAGIIGRILLPVLIVLPFVREALRVRLLMKFGIPEHAAAAFLAAAAACISALFLVYVCRQFAALETEIQALSFRDELTGLLNLRGFRMLAEQAIRLARRSNAPLSIVFVDLDRLKQINDSLGHDTGSTFLIATARLLQSTFRESDVIGRIGGDEFAVAGQFSQQEIVEATRRLQSASENGPQSKGQSIPLSLSIGYATADDPHSMDLDDLLQEADKAMYQQKRARQLQSVPYEALK
jgi:diguanylate cyclase (GGDEF)-like protein